MRCQIRASIKATARRTRAMMKKAGSDMHVTLSDYAKSASLLIGRAPRNVAATILAHD